MPPRIKTEPKTCEQCGKEFSRGKHRSGRPEGIEDWRKRRFCSRECYWIWNHGPHHWFWRGGFKRRPDGYVRRSSDDVYVHRAVVEAALGRALSTDEVVHHNDGNPGNNEAPNLVVMTNSEHRKMHCADTPHDSRGRWCRRE